MIQRLEDFQLKCLSRISASQFYSALNCPYKLALGNALRYKPLLPLSANAHFGSIIHKMIEMISKGTITNEQSFNDTWSQLINKKEEELKSCGLEDLTPIKYFVTDFALKKNQLKNILRKKEKLNSGYRSLSSFSSEKRLENFDKTITGIADMIIESNMGAIILDYKTGRIFSESIDECGITEQVIKKEYELQLKLYAHLYYLTTDSYPAALYLVTLTNDFIEVKFERAECESIYSKALDFLRKTNSSIQEKDFNSLAQPSIENCKYCAYRPACKFYTTWLVENFRDVNDTLGVVKNVTLFNNNTLGLHLTIDGLDILVNGFKGDLKKEFENLLEGNICIYNLKKTRQSINATANSYTVVYEKR